MIHKKMLLTMLLGIIAYMFLDVSVLFVGIIFSIATAMTAFSVDEKKSIQLLLSSLPYTRKEIVSSKYLSLIMYTLFYIIIIFIAKYAIHQKPLEWKQLFFIISAVMLIASFMYPFSYKYKSQYLFTVTIFVFGAYFLAIKLFIPNLNDLIREYVVNLLAFANVPILVVIAIVILVIYSVSWMLSIKIYENKVF
ncbi:ABC-2 transporter permease [Bacillus aquiflavi]|uniref:ABC-2 transporter permease n=2 Tax=Bacillus aquiflavi TaxID=2672567 RepID=A0A6B3VWL3_9BACI|nr:ABC-2 transporter permease [Bacillus aquiflavi]MBA4538301.1 ABC-2 transporter permease [Bacillus aquiflavi]NEY82620.1 ABC-2 transporter permease [Bacillus aquiflavi]UAC47484.1 ABC-2 transporter permease [Bacillus aquiflavi]